MNCVMLIGNLVRDPESKTLTNGTNLCAFTIAVNGRGKDQEAQFFRVTAWRQLAENCQRFLAKGRKVAVLGSISLNTYTKKDGTSGASLEVNADQVEFLSPKDAAEQPKPPAEGFIQVDDQDESLPF